MSKKRKREDRPLEEIEIDISAPEPHSKKALRRAKKGKSLTQPKNIPATTYNEAARKHGKSPKRSIYGIWIGNLPWTATKVDIRKFLIENSKITEEMITRVHMPSPESFAKDGETKKRPKANNKGFAYVDFVNQ